MSPVLIARVTSTASGSSRTRRILLVFIVARLGQLAPLAFAAFARWLTPAVAAAREFPDTSNGIFWFDDQLDTSSMSDAQFAFAATHEVGTQKVVVSAARRLTRLASHRSYSQPRSH